MPQFVGRDFDTRLATRRAPEPRPEAPCRQPPARGSREEETVDVKFTVRDLPPQHSGQPIGECDGAVAGIRLQPIDENLASQLVGGDTSSDLDLASRQFSDVGHLDGESFADPTAGRSQERNERRISVINVFS